MIEPEEIKVKVDLDKRGNPTVETDGIQTLTEGEVNILIDKLTRVKNDSKEAKIRIVALEGIFRTYNGGERIVELKRVSDMSPE